ncbi:MAG: Modification methylase DpnIIA [Bacteroidetes bacterium ADurb.BinA104]|nr:MAG: Modification methylase DpnIIA [Bacteroidetes bacterium ADurb.BinA104]
MDALIGWIGGKRLLRKVIAPYVPKDITGFIEPFGGAAWMLLYKEKWAELEVYNDLDNRLVNLFLQVKYHPDELIKELDWLVASRKLFGDILKQEGLTEIQRAARFMFLITRSYGSKGDSFGISQKRGVSSMCNRLERIKELHKRLDMVIIENLSYEKVIEKYDTKSNFFYCDPPYMQGYTYENSKQFSHEDLCAKLKKIKGRFILSYDDNPEVLKLYKGFDIKHVTRTKGINRKQGKSEFKEVIIANFDLVESDQEIALTKAKTKVKTTRDIRGIS